jgi:hypothetical protein
MDELRVCSGGECEFGLILLVWVSEAVTLLKFD